MRLIKTNKESTQLIHVQFYPLILTNVALMSLPSIIMFPLRFSKLFAHIINQLHRHVPRHV